MVTRLAVSLLAALLVAGCRPGSISPSAQSPPPPVVRAYTQFSAGEALDVVREQLGLDKYEVRYRSAMPPGQIGAVYFLDEGNLHIDAKKIGDTWAILSVPLLDPSTKPAAERAAEWDRGADPQENHSASER